MTDDHFHHSEALPDDDNFNWDAFLSDIDTLTASESDEDTPSMIPEAKPAKKSLPGLRIPRKLIAIGAAALMVILLAGILLPVVLDPYDRKILSGVSIGGLDVGGMTRSEARKALRSASETTLEQLPLSLQLPKQTLELSPEDTKLSVKAGAAVRAAYRVGRSGSREERQAALDAAQAGETHFIGLEPYLKRNEKFIRSILADYALQYDTDLTPGSYRTEGDMPDLSTANAADAVDCQTLIITMGLPTARLDQENAFDQILAVYDRAFEACREGTYLAKDFRVDILEEATHPDLQEIYDTLCITPVDDSLDMNTYQPVPGSYGYSFDLEQAGAQMEAADYGETLSIPMAVTAPEIIGDGVYFRDVLGHCETPHTKDENRNHNLKLACKAMDGMILQPGDVFSYNDTLGQRTKERGYKKAGAYSGWELVQSYGGGICQGSTTIYCAALYADLEIVVRKNHGYKVGYIGVGLDATVNWGGPDFQFRNNTHFPIKIAAEVSDGHVKVTLLGTEERDYYVEMESESGQDQYAIYARSYKCKYDRKTGELISRELEAKSTYNI